jgi:hypothetical protein
MALASTAVLAAAPLASAATPRAGGPATGTGTWRVQKSPDLTTPAGALASISCVTAHACTAVGSYVDKAGRFVTLAEAWNGTSWRRQPTPSPAGGSNLLLTGVSCASTDFCEAVGSYIVRGGAARLGLAEEWNGRTWTLESMPAPGGSPDVEPAAVSCIAATVCEAVGTYQSSPGVLSPLAEVWNGTSWTSQPAGAAGMELTGVSCLSAAFCEAVGSSSPLGQNAEVWNGRSWVPQFTPAPAHAVGLAFSAVSCVATNVCEAVGNWLAPGGELPRAVVIAEGWNGKTWAIQHTPRPRALPYSNLAGVSCTSTRFCAAIGSNYDPVSATSVTLAEQWNGTSWRIVPTPRASGSFVELNGVSCTAANACEAAGINQLASFTALAEAWDGRSWKIQPGAAPAGAANNQFFAVSCVTAGFCEAVGDSMDPTGRNIALAEVWNGAAWKIQPIPSPVKLSNVRAILLGVSCVSAAFCVAVGQSNSTPGLLTEVWNGTSWKIEAAPGMGDLASVSCPSVSFCAAVGGTGTISGASAEADLWNGHSWSAVSLAPGFTSLTSVSCVSASFCEAVGVVGNSGGPGAQVWNGRAWSPRSTPLPAGVSPQAVNLNGVSCPAPNACEAVGGYFAGPLRSATLAEVWNGKAWAIQPSPSPMPRRGPSLTAVWCASAVSCTAVGNIGQLGQSTFLLTLAEAWDGRSWQVQSTPTPHLRAGGGALDGVWCAASLACTAVGFSPPADSTPQTLVEARG